MVNYQNTSDCSFLKSGMILAATLIAVCSLLLIGTSDDSTASSGSHGNCTWSLDDNYNLVIEAKPGTDGRMADYPVNFRPPWGPIVNSVTICDGVTHIGNSTFYQSPAKSVEIANTVTSIGEYAFDGCIHLTSVVLPDSMTSIGRLAFYRCYNLATVNLPSSLTSINTMAFASTSLTSVVIPDSVTTIGSSAFSGCTSLPSVVIPNSVTSIEESVFNGCTSLSSIVIHDAVTTIGASAFRGCSSLTSIVIPDSVTSVGESAFNGCSSLTSVVIPDSVTSIEGSVFNGCTSLSSIVIHDAVTTIGASAFRGCSSLTSIVIPDSVTSVGESAFNRCSSLTSVVIGNGVKYIRDGTFESCTSLSSLVIGNRVISIGSIAFNGCTSLTSVTIPDSVIYIGMWAFKGCTSLVDIHISDNVNLIRKDAFSLGTATYKVNCKVWGCSEGKLDSYGCYTKFTYMTHTLTVNYTGCPDAPATHVERLNAGESYSVTTPVIQGYTSDEPVVSGVMSYNNVNVTVVYTVNTHTLTIKYEGCDVPGLTAEFAYGYKYSVDSPVIEGYTPDIKTVKGSMPDHDVKVTVTYTEDVSAASMAMCLTSTISDDEPELGAPQNTGAYTLTILYAGCPNPPATHVEHLNAGDTYSVTSPAVEGYTSDEPVVKGVMPARNIIVTVVYTVNTYTLTVTYTGYTYPISDYTAEVAYGTEYAVESPEKWGFSPDKEVVSGVMPAHDVTITVTYKDVRIKITVTVDDAALGTLDEGATTVVLYTLNGDEIIQDGEVLYVGDRYVTAFVKTASDANVTNIFTGFTIPGGATVVTADMTVTAGFDAVLTGVTPGETGVFTVSTDSDRLNIPAGVLTEIKEKCTSFTVYTSAATVSFDQAAIAKITSEGVLSTILLEKSQYPEVVKDAFSVISVSFGDNHDFTGGKVTVTVPVTASGDLVVGYVHDGRVEKVESSYDPVTETVTFTTDHLSEYAVLDSSYFAKTLSDSARLIVTALAVVAILALLSVYVYKTSRTE